MYNPADIRWDVLNDIMSLYYLHIYRIFGLKGLTKHQPTSSKLGGVLYALAFWLCLGVCACIECIEFFLSNFGLYKLLVLTKESSLFNLRALPDLVDL